VTNKTPFLFQVIKMDIIMEVLSELEHISITKEALEVESILTDPYKFFLKGLTSKF